VVYQQQQQEDGSGGSGRRPQQAVWVAAIGEDAGWPSQGPATELAEAAVPLPPQSSPHSLALRLSRHSAPLALQMHRSSPPASTPQSPGWRGAAGSAAGEAPSPAGEGAGSMPSPFGAGNLQWHSTGASFPGGQPSHSPSLDWSARQASGLADPAAAAAAAPTVVVDADAEDSQLSITRLMGACCACCACAASAAFASVCFSSWQQNASQCLAGQAGNLCNNLSPSPPAAFVAPLPSHQHAHARRCCLHVTMQVPCTHSSCGVSSS
jgi:hypothetical protein